MNRIVHAFKLGSGETAAYVVPSLGAAIAHSKATWGKQFDRVENRVLEGGLPMLWERAEPVKSPID